MGSEERRTPAEAEQYRVLIETGGDYMAVEAAVCCETCGKNVSRTKICQDMECGSDNGFPHWQPRGD